MGSHHLAMLNMITTLTTLFCLVLATTAINLEDIADVRTGGQKSREPKLFYVSSSSTTSSVSTHTVCFSSTSTGVTTCSGRKRRNIITSPYIDDSSLIIPHRINNDQGEESDVDQLSGGVNGEIRSERDGRFLLYWLTTTTTSTTTIFTGTSVLATLDCTPNGFTLNGCGGK